MSSLLPGSVNDELSDCSRSNAVSAQPQQSRFRKASDDEGGAKSLVVDGDLRNTASPDPESDPGGSHTRFGGFRAFNPDALKPDLGSLKPDLGSLKPDLGSLMPDVGSTLDLGAARENIHAGLANVRQIVLEYEEHDKALRESVAEVGLMTEDMDDDALFVLRKKVTVAAEAKVSLHGQPRQLLILQRGPSESKDTARPETPAEALLCILDAVKRSLKDEVAKATTTWPLHDKTVSAAVMGLDAKELLKDGLLSGDSWRDRAQRTVFKVLRALRVTRPNEERCRVFTEHYGPGVDFALTWTAFFIQQLWFMVPFALLWTWAGVRRWHQTDKRWLWEIMKFVIVLWAFLLALQSTWRFPRIPNSRMKMPSSKRKSGKSDAISKTYVEKEGWGRWCRRLAELVFLAVPSLLALLGLVIVVMSGMTMLVLNVIYIWGDCIHLHSKDRPCRDAEVKYSVLGWAAEVSIDILLAILFEVFFSCIKGSCGWIASLLNFKYESDEVLTREMLELSLAAVERIGFCGSLAFLFAPQWTHPLCLGPEIGRLDLFCDCSEYVFGDADYRCYQRRLSVDTRRWVFESLMKGPFVVAPFIGILVKVLMPKAIQKITRYVERGTQSKCCCCLAPLRGILRLASLIFTYEGDGVGGFKFVFRGAPYGQNPIPDEEPEAPRLRAALDQVKLKPFMVQDELMELEMGLLWVAFFMPILPIGVVFTMAARLIEVNSDVTKMLYVRRRPVPVDDRLLRREMNAYTWCVAVSCCGWSTGLSLITYNNDLHEWGWFGLFIGFGITFFLVFGSATALVLFMRCTKLKSTVSSSDAPSSSPSDTSLR